eukprot:1019792-Pleurochrysis_carterae.AAC.1
MDLASIKKLRGTLNYMSPWSTIASLIPSRTATFSMQQNNRNQNSNQMRSQKLPSSTPAQRCRGECRRADAHDFTSVKGRRPRRWRLGRNIQHAHTLP